MADLREAVAWNLDSDEFEDLIFRILSDPLRRKMLMSLALKSSQPAKSLDNGRHPDLMCNAVKHLIIMRNAGFITATTDRVDGRRALYSLSPALSAALSEDKCRFHFSLPKMTAEMFISVTPKAIHKQWNEETVYWTLADRPRRRLLLALVHNGPQPAVHLPGAAGRNLEGTLKRLASLRRRGWLTMKEDPKDRRRSLYALSPDVPLTTEGTTRILDFGFCTLRFG